MEITTMAKRIYFDYAATTPVDPDVFEIMKPYFLEKFGNPSSIHQFGQEAAKAVVEARQSVARFLNCQPAEVIFTSGATEGNNTIIRGLGVSQKLRQNLGGGKPHLIVSQIEHDCVLNSARQLAKDGLAEVSYLPVNRDSLVEIGEVEKNIKSNTILISVMYANNETGAIQPIAEIGQLLKELNKNRQNKIYFHTDAAQAVNYLDCDSQKLGVDFMTISAHKIYGPKGIGALFVRQGAPFERFLEGGEQEFKMRAGTHNVSGIVGLGAAIDKVSQLKSKIKDTQKLRDKLIDGVLKNIPQSFLNGSRELRLPNNTNFRFEGVEGEAVLIALDLEGMAISTGSACAAKSLEPSHVLQAMGLKPLESHSSIRLSLGRFTSESEIDKVLALLPGIIEKLRTISGGVGERTKDKLLKNLGC